MTPEERKHLSYVVEVGQSLETVMRAINGTPLYLYPERGLVLSVLRGLSAKTLSGAIKDYPDMAGEICQALNDGKYALPDTDDPKGAER